MSVWGEFQYDGELSGDIRAFRAKADGQSHIYVQDTYLTFKENDTGPSFVAGSFLMMLYRKESTIYGSSGNDRFVLYGDSDLKIKAKMTFYAKEGDDDISMGDSKDTVYGGDGKDRIYGGAGADFLSGGDGDDRLYGGHQGDWLQGDKGNDLLVGGYGTDGLSGGDGDDRLIGGTHYDSLWGGAGADDFVYLTLEDSTVKWRDSINDFELGIDDIDLRRIDADPTQPGDQGFTYIGEKKFSGAIGELRCQNGYLSANLDDDPTDSEFLIRYSAYSDIRALALEDLAL